MNLKPFVGRSVLVQLKQPYVYQLARANGNSLVPFAVVVQNGRQRLATPEDIENVQPAVVGIIAATVVEKQGEIFLECDEPTGGSRKIEVMIHPDLIGWVSALGDEKLVRIIS